MARWELCAAWLCLVAASVCAQTNWDPRAERVRADCIEGRRMIAGRVLQITKAGLVVDSGYPTLLEPPLNHSWVVRAPAAPERPSALVERATPDALAVGLVLLTDFPRRTVVHRYDYVSLHGYPAGSYEYVPVAGVTNNIRRFAGGLETAVKLNLASTSQPPQK